MTGRPDVARNRGGSAAAVAHEGVTDAVSAESAMSAESFFIPFSPNMLRRILSNTGRRRAYRTRA